MLYLRNLPEKVSEHVQLISGAGTVQQLYHQKTKWEKKQAHHHKNETYDKTRKRLQRTRLSASHFLTLSFGLSCLRNWSCLFSHCIVLHFFALVSVVSVLRVWCDRTLSASCFKCLGPLRTCERAWWLKVDLIPKPSPARRAGKATQWR